jgi:hypothetical protein
MAVPTFVLICLQPTFPNWSVFNLKQSMKKLEPHGMELLEQVPVTECIVF